MAVVERSKEWFKTNYTNKFSYSTIGGQIAELGTVISSLNTIKDDWDEVCYSNEPFYNSFLTDIEDLITHLNTYKSYLETQGKDLQKMAEWTD